MVELKNKPAYQPDGTWRRPFGEVNMTGSNSEHDGQRSECTALTRQGPNTTRSAKRAESAHNN